jgi:hypothetical protein
MLILGAVVPVGGVVVGVGVGDGVGVGVQLVIKKANKTTTARNDNFFILFPPCKLKYILL